MIRILTLSYFIIGLTNVLSQLFSWPEVNLFTKPLLMPLLIFYVMIYAKGVVTLPRLLMAFGLTFSWVGDVVLMWQNSETYFLLGLGAFLIAQVVYTLTLAKARKRKAPLNANR